MRKDFVLATLEAKFQLRLCREGEGVNEERFHVGDPGGEVPTSALSQKKKE